MNYKDIYTDLMQKALFREITGKLNLATYYESHHILPRSMGGKDDPGNLVRLTVKEHALAHLLLFKMGHPNQIFSYECFLNDAINPNRPHRFGVTRWKRWIRKALALQRAENLRLKRRERLSKSFSDKWNMIDAAYVEDIIATAFDE